MESLYFFHVWFQTLWVILVLTWDFKLGDLCAVIWNSLNQLIHRLTRIIKPWDLSEKWSFLKESTKGKILILECLLKIYCKCLFFRCCPHGEIDSFNGFAIFGSNCALVLEWESAIKSYIAIDLWWWRPLLKCWCLCIFIEKENETNYAMFNL